jgi:hypothetical protein
MSEPFPPPPKGAMYLFDYARPPLTPDLYRMEVKTDVSFDGESHPLQDDRYFEVVGPRFALDPTDVAGVFPPRNGHGPFMNSLAHIAIKRRTLPWERSLDKGDPIDDPSDGEVLPGIDSKPYPTPWLALLIFEEDEYDLLQNVPLEQVVPASVYARLGRPANVLCEAVEAEKSLVQAIMPSKQELQLLTHVRWVNVEDRELSVEGSNGWFAVVMTNRIPSPGKKCRACLVSLEERSDLVRRDAPPSELPDLSGLHFDMVQLDVGGSFRKRSSHIERLDRDNLGRKLVIGKVMTRLVVLHSWPFTCEGDGTFFNLMQGLDVGMLGKVQREGEPAVTDTGHLQLALHDRGGTTEPALYRGPLVPFELTRDPLGPYHSADQCRRASPEAGVEDISYAAAFEAGRLLAAADGRLAQELMRWRREAYRQSARGSNLNALAAQLNLDLPVPVAERVHAPLVPVVSARAISRFAAGAAPVADRYGLAAASKAIGLDAATVRDVWGLASLADAQAILGGDPASTGVEIPEPPATPRPATTLGAVVADTASADRLKAVRQRIQTNANVRLGGEVGNP